MAIVFLQQKKIQKNLILVFGLVLLITVIVIWRGFFKEEKKVYTTETIIPSQKEVKINFEILETPILQKLQLFPEIKPFKETPPAEGKPGEKVGRENPFTPY